MSILTDLQDQMKMAMRSRDQARLDALRLMVSAIKYVQVDTPELDDAGVIQVLTKEAKKRREAILAFKEAGRADQAAQEEYELKLIEEYLPKMMSEDEVRVVVNTILKDVANISMGEAMKMVQVELKGKADGGTVSKIVKELIALKS